MQPEPTSAPAPSVPTYWDYLQIDTLLGLQGGLAGDESGLSADELLFIIVHQSYELWFKQVLRELKEAHSTMLGERIGALESELRAESEQLLEVRQAQLETQERLRLESDGRSQVEAELGTTREKLDVTIGTLEERKADI